MVGLAAIGTASLHGSDNVIAGDDLSEDDVAAVQVRSVGGADEELRAVGVGASVGHGQAARAEVLSGTAAERLVCEFLTVDGLAAGSIAASEVTTLTHEAGDNSVERGVLEGQELAAAGGDTLLTGAEASEVLGSLRDNILEELELNSASFLSGDLNQEENLWVSSVDWVEGDLRSEIPTEKAEHRLNPLGVREKERKRKIELLKVREGESCAGK